MLTLTLQCVAALSSFYWRSNEESVEGDRPQKAPVLESRESDSAFASNSRADPVQGMSYREIFVTKILSLFLQPNAASNTDSLLMARAPNALLLLALALAATLAGGSLHSNWPAFRHSKAGFGPRVRVHRASINVVRPEQEQGNDKPNDKLIAQFIHVEQTLQDSLSAAQRRQLLLTAR